MSNQVVGLYRTLLCKCFRSPIKHSNICWTQSVDNLYNSTPSSPKVGNNFILCRRLCLDAVSQLPKISDVKTHGVLERRLYSSTSVSVQNDNRHKMYARPGL